MKGLPKEAHLVLDEVRTQIQSWLHPKALGVKENGKADQKERGVKPV